jgi:hypothetical protein
VDTPCGALWRGKKPCPKPAKTIKYSVLPLCETHLLKIQAEMRHEFYWERSARKYDLLAEAADKIPVPKKSPQVYFIRAGHRIKIGFSINPGMRLTSIRSGMCKAPHGLDTSKARIVALEPGGRERELELHQQFAHLREAGEWFRRAPELNTYIDQMAA